MKVAMISQPMNGLTERQIEKKRKESEFILESMGYRVLNTFFSEEFNKSIKEQDVVNIPLKFLAKSIDSMSKCNTVYFVKNWDSARGCVVERQIAEKYGLEILDELV